MQKDLVEACKDEDGMREKGPAHIYIWGWYHCLSEMRILVSTDCVVVIVVPVHQVHLYALPLLFLWLIAPQPTPPLIRNSLLSWGNLANVFSVASPDSKHDIKKDGSNSFYFTIITIGGSKYMKATTLSLLCLQ